MKWFAIVGMVLFLGVALAPSINADFGATENKFIDISVESIGLDNPSKTVRISMDKVRKIQDIFDEYNELDSPTFNDLLGIVDVLHQTEVLNAIETKRIKHNFHLKNTFYEHLSNHIDKSLNLESKTNVLCQTVGRFNFGTVFFNYLNPLLLPVYLTYIIPLPTFLWALRYLYVGIIQEIKPFQLLGLVSFGETFIIDSNDGETGSTTELTTTGWVNTNGVLGDVNWSGELSGQFFDIRDISFTKAWGYTYVYIEKYHIGIIGFTGIKIRLLRENYISGFSLIANIEEVEER